MTITGPWAEGDPLTPTHLNSRGGGNFPDRTYNAGWKRFGTPAVAKEIRIQAAITQAVADGVPTVFVPASMLPYDASAVTFNNAVWMVCEGQNNPGEFDVRAYGAALNNSQDDYAAITAAIAAARHQAVDVATTGHETPIFVSFGLGARISKPLWLNGNGLKLYGGKLGAYAGYGTAAIVSNYFGGPSVLVSSTAQTLPLTTGIVAGHNQALSFPTDNTKWIDLRDIPSIESINGLSAICVEAFVNPTDATGGEVVSSSGSLLPSGVTSQNLILGLSGQNLVGLLRLSVSGIKGGVSGTVPSGTTSHIAVTYDGANVRTFINGALIATSAGTGTVVQAYDTALTLGPQRTYADGGALNSGLKGIIGPVRISNISRYTAPFTPPSDLTNDANTIALVNGDVTTGPFIQVLTGTGGGNGWSYVRYDSTAAGSVGVEVSDLVFHSVNDNSQSGGVHIGQNCIQTQVKRCSFQNTRDGVHSPMNSYESRFEELYISCTDGRYGFVYRGGLGKVQAVEVWPSYRIPILGTNATLFSRVFSECGTTTVFGAMFLSDSANGGSQIDSLNVSTEAGVSAAFISPLVISAGMNGVVGLPMTFTNVALETNTSTPHVTVDDTSNAAVGLVQFIGGTFVRQVTPAATIFHIIGTPIAPIKLSSIQKGPGNWLPWSDVAGSVMVEKLGKLTAIAFATPLTLDCSVRDDFELGALTGAITINFSNVTPGQKISLWTVQNAGGGNAITFGTVNGAGAVKGATANDTTGLHYSQYLFDANINGNMTQIGFSSGA